MKSMKSMMSSCLMVLAGVVLACNAESGEEAHNKTAPSGKTAVVTIKGVITNLAAGKARITGDTYLQLLLIPPDGKLSVKAEAGFLSFPSSLARVSMPAKGPFSLACSGLASGTYVLVVQKYVFSTDGVRPFLLKGERPLEIKISDSTASVLDVGEVTLPIPAP